LQDLACLSGPMAYKTAQSCEVRVTSCTGLATAALACIVLRRAIRRSVATATMLDELGQ